MTTKLNPITKEGYQKLEQKIENLKRERPTKIKALQVARALGDLSENADYSSAKRDLRHLESQLRFITNQLQYSEIIEVVDDGKVSIGKEVTIEFLDDHFLDTFKIAGNAETNIDEQKISLDSPLGKAIKECQVGDVVEVSAPDSTYQVKIKNITI